MTSESRDRKTQRSVWISSLVSILATIASITRESVANVLGQYVHLTALARVLREEWLYATLVAITLVAVVVAIWSVLRLRTQTEESASPPPSDDPAQPPPGDSPRPPGVSTRSFPSRVPLAGHHAADAGTVAAYARRDPGVLVTGAVGSGASAVAIEAGWKLAPDPARQRYVDLREDSVGAENQRRTIIRVLRELGLPLEAADPWDARQVIAGALARTGIALVLDNAASPEQVSWLMEGIPGAYVIACGDIWFGENPPRGVEHVQVRALDSDAALELMVRQGAARTENEAGDDARPRALARLLRRETKPLRRETKPPGAPPPANTVAERVNADPGAARELAGHLALPRVSIDMGQWLAAHPEVQLADLVSELRGGQAGSELRYILSRQLDGTSSGARRLLALLATASPAELTEAAVARLAGLGPERAGEYLAELTRRSLVRQPRPSKCRITPQARQLAADPVLVDPPGHRAVAKAHARLAGYYGKLAAAHADDLDKVAARDWLSADDAAMLQLLQDPNPPRRAASHLWHVADVLDAWFARERRPEDQRAAAEAMEDTARALADAPSAVTACLRLAALARESGDFSEAVRHLERAGEAAGRRMRLQLQVDAAWTTHLTIRGDLDQAREHLQRCRNLRPRGDQRGRVTDLVNQAALELRRGENGSADGILSEALELAVRARDTAGEAHACELSGIVAARGGARQRARREWERARALYERSGDGPGTARCLQHEGTLLSVDPGGPWDVGVAADMLTRSLELRGERPAGLGPALACLYLIESGRAADGRALRETGLEALRAWPYRGTEPPQVTAVRERLESVRRRYPPPEHRSP